MGYTFRCKQPRIKNYHSCFCKEGHWHHSRGEAAYCNQLYIQLRQGKIREIVRQKRFVLKVEGYPVTTHIVDFVVTKNDGHMEVVEYKGFGTEMWRIKKKLFEALYPDLPYVVVTRKDLW